MQRLAAMLCVLGTQAWAQDFDQSVRDLFADDPSAYRWVIERFQGAVRDGDGKAAAALVDYPIEVQIGNARRVMRNETDFAAHFAEIVTQEIAAAVANEPIDDMMVNYQGVMLGRGEVWVSGVCDDSACARPQVRVITIQSVPTDEPAGVGEVKAFHDWRVGCDNGGGCTAIGLPPDGGSDGYLVLRRAAGAAEVPALDAVLLAPDGTPDGAGTTMRVEVKGKHAHPATDWPSTVVGSWVRATAPKADLATVLGALRDGDHVELQLGGGAAVTVSLRGATASMLRIDDVQGRVGTVTAMARPGTAPAATVAPAPDLPAVEMRPIRALDPAPDLPAGITPAADPSCDGVAPQAWALDGGATLWGVCELSGAYNLTLRLSVAGPDSVAPAAFDIPGRRIDDPALLTSPGVSDDGRTLTALDLGRGLGDCGEAAAWAWTGDGFALVRLASFDTCAGVSPDDWPLLWRAD